MPQNPLAVDGVEGGVEGDAETGEPFEAEESSQPELASVPSFATEQMRLALGGPGAPSNLGEGAAAAVGGPGNLQVR